MVTELAKEACLCGFNCRRERKGALLLPSYHGSPIERRKKDLGRAGEHWIVGSNAKAVLFHFPQNKIYFA